MLTLSKRYLEMEQAANRGTGGVSTDNRHLGFVPAFTLASGVRALLATEAEVA